MSTKIYEFRKQRHIINPNFDDSVAILDRYGLTGETYASRVKDMEANSLPTDDSLRACLISNNASVSNTLNKGEFLIKTQYKWATTLIGNITDTETGEILKDQVYEFTDLESSYKKQRKLLWTFASTYEPLYQAKKVSCMFLTFTSANKTDCNMRDTMSIIKKRFKTRNLPIYGYMWVSEVSPTFHWHYHLAIVTKRVYWKKIPTWIKLDKVWGMGTRFEFIKKSVASYLSKYIGKDNIGRIMNYRAYGRSRRFDSPI